MLNPTLQLGGKTALVTGASRGLGRGIALVLAEQGADVVINFRSAQSEAESVAAQIQALGRRALLIQADVSREQEVQAMFARIASEWGSIDFLVNNAGTSRAQDIFETSIEEWQGLINVNLTSTFLCCKLAMESMRQAGGGRIINISSVVGQQGALFGHVHYAATKSGQLGLTKTLARTGAPLGITVNAIAPGIIETELLEETHGARGIEDLTAKVPLGLGTPRDVGLSVAFLCGEGGRYITGATLDVNGGLYMR